MDHGLSGVPETMLIPLWARAFETNRHDPIIRDHKACDMVSKIDYDFSKFENAWLSQVGISVRTMLIDRVAQSYLDRHKDVVVINLGSGLDTRLGRLGQENIYCWYDLDLPEGIALRRRFFDENEKNCFIEKSFFDLSWIDDLDRDNRPVLIIAEGLFMYFSEEELKPFFIELASRLPGSFMIFEMMAPMLIGKANRHDALKNMDEASQFKWGLVDSSSMESWSSQIKYLKEWDYFDYFKSRWSWFGYIARMPFIKPRLSNRIVCLKFKKR